VSAKSKQTQKIVTPMDTKSKYEEEEEKDEEEEIPRTR
jgi:hypothetical protein